MTQPGARPSSGGVGPTQPPAGHAAAPRLPSPDALLRDEQTLLAGAVQRLHETSALELVAAWALRGAAEPYVAAAAFEGEPPVAPDAAAFAAAAHLPRASELEPTALPEPLAAVLGGYRCAAAAPIRHGEAAPNAVLVAADRRRATVPPRTLAALESTARRLAAPLAAAHAARRLAEIDAGIRRLDRLSALGALAAEVAHEVRNPLVSVKTFLQLLPERQHDPDFVTRFLAVANQELQRVERLLDLLIEYPRAADLSGSASVHAALEATGELVGHLARSRGAELECRGPARLPEVALGEDALRQLLLNLVLNAIEVTPEGGRIELAARGEAGGVELCVSDAGPGIAPGERPHLFEPFHSTRGGGHGGLGLSISQRIVAEAGGSIAVEAAPSGGARFRVWLPSA